MIPNVRTPHETNVIRGRLPNKSRACLMNVLTVLLQEFIIHTPSKDAQKMYIGNAMKGNVAAVFAQLIINGESRGKSDPTVNFIIKHRHFIITVSDLNKP